jgi:hypothetical protein
MLTRQFDVFPTGILKFLTPNPTVSLSLGEQEVNCGKELRCHFLRSNAEVCSNATSSEFQFHVEASAGNPRAESSSDFHSLNAMPVSLQHKGVLSNQLEDKSRLQSSSNQSGRHSEQSGWMLSHHLLWLEKFALCAVTDVCLEYEIW